MKQNQKEALVTLLGAIGFILILVAILTDLLPFTYALVGAIVVWIITGIVERQLKLKKTNELIVGVMCLLGLLFLLAGIFTELVSFNYGLLIAIILWILSGVVGKYLGMK